MKINGSVFKSTKWFADGTVSQYELLGVSLETSVLTDIATWLSTYVPSLSKMPGNDLSTLGEPVLMAKFELPAAQWHSPKTGIRTESDVGTIS